MLNRLQHSAGPASFAARALLWTWLAYWAFLLVIMHLPKPPGAELAARLGDAVAHGMAYFVLAGLGIWARAVRCGSLPAGWLWKWWTVYALYAAADELLQPLTNRTRQFSDWVGDVAGVTLAMLILPIVLNRLNLINRSRPS